MGLGPPGKVQKFAQYDHPLQIEPLLPGEHRLPRLKGAKRCAFTFPGCGLKQRRMCVAWIPDHVRDDRERRFYIAKSASSHCRTCANSYYFCSNLTTPTASTSIKNP